MSFGLRNKEARRSGIPMPDPDKPNDLNPPPTRKERP